MYVVYYRDIVLGIFPDWKLCSKSIEYSFSGSEIVEVVRNRWVVYEGKTSRELCRVQFRSVAQSLKNLKDW